MPEDLAVVESKVHAAIESTAMFGRGDLVVVGVSGGPDSVALLCALSRLRQQLGYELCVAHLNHRLRGRQSDADAELVRALSERMGVPARIEAREVAPLARRYRLGVEEAARVVRYEFFAQVIQDLEACCVAVGHTADDQVETVVMHWLRGAGLAGLQGMRPVTYQLVGLKWAARDRQRVKVVRPMLDVSRQEVEEYVRARRLPTCVDVSNVDRRFLRNRVRLDLLPYLEQFNPKFREAVLRSARIAAQDYDYIQSQVLAVWETLAREETGAVTIDLNGWRALPPSLQYYVLRQAAIVLLGEAMDISAANLEAAVEAMRTKPVGTSIVWPRQLRLVKGYDEFRLIVGEPAVAKAIRGRQRLNIPGVTGIKGTGWQVVARITTERCTTNSDRWHADLDYEIVGPELYVRKRQPGDAFQPLGMDQVKKLQDFFVDEKVPRDQRDQVPIVVSPSQIVWVAGHRIDHRARVTDRTKRVLCLTFREAGS